MKTILIVEDDANLRQIMSFSLDVEGREVLICDNGAEALAILAEKGRQIDLLVLDLGLPGIDGVEITRQMKADPVLKTIPILLCTGKTKAEITKGMQVGATDYIHKPFSIENLLMRIEILLTKQEVDTPA